jgi:hypothetical protein
MQYLLGTNAIIALLNDTTSPIARRVRRHAPRDFGVPTVVIHELYYGAFKSQRLEQNVARVDALPARDLQCRSGARRPDQSAPRVEGNTVAGLLKQIEGLHGSVRRAHRPLHLRNVPHRGSLNADP